MSTPLPPSLLYKHRLRNGLQIVGHVMPEYASVALSYTVRVGARDEQDASLSGVSHFLEHMVFKGTKLHGWRQLKQAFTSMGAIKNGSTSVERTIYYLHVLEEYGDRAFLLLSEMMEPHLDKNDFEQEKGVILNEIARAEDQPRNYAHRRMMHAYFDSHPLGNYVLGLPESISSMHIEQMRAYWREFYGANNIILSVAGKFNWEQLVERAEQICGTWPTSTGTRTVTPFLPLHSSTTVVVKPYLKQQIVLLAMPGIPSTHPEYEALTLGWRILGQSQGSRLYWNIRQKGWAEYATAGFWSFDGTGLLFLEAATTPENAPRVLVLLQEELQHLLEDGISEEELRCAKEKRISSIIYDAELPYERMRTLSMDWLYDGRLSSIEERIAQIEQVTSSDVMSALHHLPLRERQVLTALGPLNHIAI